MATARGRKSSSHWMYYFCDTAAMKPIIKTAKKMSRGPVTISGIRQPPTRAFIDDITITAKSVPDGHGMLQDLEKNDLLVKDEVQV